VGERALSLALSLTDHGRTSAWKACASQGLASLIRSR
jgi:hypothetical protein